LDYPQYEYDTVVARFRFIGLSLDLDPLKVGTLVMTQFACIGENVTVKVDCQKI